MGHVGRRGAWEYRGVRIDVQPVYRRHAVVRERGLCAAGRSVCLLTARCGVRNACGLRDGTALVASGKLVNPGDIAWTLTAGAAWRALCPDVRSVAGVQPVAAE